MCGQKKVEAKAGRGGIKKKTARQHNRERRERGKKSAKINKEQSHEILTPELRVAVKSDRKTDAGKKGERGKKGYRRSDDNKRG